MSSPLLENVVKAVSPSMHAKLYPLSSSSFNTTHEKTKSSSPLSSNLISSSSGKKNSVARKTTSFSSGGGEKKIKKSVKEDSSEDEEDDDEPQCTPEKEEVNEILPKSPHKSALKPLELRLAARFGQDSPRRKSISFANEEEFQVKLIPKNQTGTPEVTCMISGSMKRKVGEAERLAQESWGLSVLSGKRERKPSRISFTCNKNTNTTASTTTPTSSNEDKENENNDKNNNNNKKPRRSSVSFKPACSDDEDTTPPTRKSGARKVQDTPATKKSHNTNNNNSNMTPSPNSSIETNKTNKTAPLTSGGLKSRPEAPNNTPANTNGNEIFNLEGFDLFRSTPNAKAIRDALFETKEEDAKDDIAATKCLNDCEKLLKSQPPAMELAQALEKLAEPQVTPGRAVMEWLSDAENHSNEDENEEEEEFDEGKENAKTPPSSTKSSNKSPATLCIKAKKSKKMSKKMKKNKKEKSMSYALAMKFEQLHNALEQTQLALLKERKKTMKLRKLFLEAAERENNKEERKVSTKSLTEEKTEKKKNDTTCVMCNEINDTVKVTMRCVKCNCFAHGKCCKPALRRAPKEWTCPKC